MNENNKLDCLGRIQQSHVLNNGDLSSEFGNFSSCHQYFNVKQQALNMGTSSHQLAMACGDVGGGGAEQQPPYIGSAKSSSSSIISRFESPASAFYATEIFMGFPQYSCQVGSPSLVSQFSKNTNDLEFPLYQSSKESPLYQAFELPNNTLQPMKSQLSSDQCCRTPEKSNKVVPCGNFHGSNFLPIEQHKLFIDAAAEVTRSPSIPSKGNQDHVVGCGSYNLPVAQMSFSSQQEKLSPTLSVGSASLTSSIHASNGPMVSSSKTRIRWTQDLHEKFVECVNRLGGAEKATPKAILRLMESDGLTIFHVKSHLQKYRIAKYIPESIQGKSDKRAHAENVDLDVKTGLQIREALQLQLDVQRRLHEQLEIQRKLQLRIEEQGKQLKMMFDQQQQQKSTSSLLNTKNEDSTDNNENRYKDVEVTISEGSGNSFLNSKIS